MKHSKITSIVLALCMLVTLMVVPVAAEATNLVPDGSFETWGDSGIQGEAWTVICPGNGDTHLVGLTDELASEGTYSMKMASTATSTGSRKAVYVNIGSFEKDTIVKVSVKVKTTILGNTDTDYGRLIVRSEGDAGPVNNNSVGEAFPIQKVTAVADGWVTLTSQSKMDNFTKEKNLFLGFETYSKNFEFYLDEFTAEVVVEEEEEPEVEVNDEPGERIVDGSFETWGSTGVKDSAWTILKPNGIVEASDAEASDGTYSMKIQSNENSTNARKGIFVNIGSFSEGTTIRVSLKVNVKSINEQYARLMVRFNNDAGPTDNNVVGEAFPFCKFTTATDGWTLATTESTINDFLAGKEVFVGFEVWGTDHEIYIDELSAEVLAPGSDEEEEEVIPAIVTNGDFENGLSGWTQTAKNGTIEVVTEDNNSYLKISDAVGDANQVWVTQAISGLDATKKYRVSMDVYSPATEVDRGTGQADDVKGFAHTDGLKVGTTDVDFSIFSQLTTYGKWAGYQIEFTGKTEVELRLMCFNPVNDTAAGYACFDNIVVEEVVNDGNLISNGSFESGRNGLGQYSGRYGITSGTYGYWKFGQYGNSTVMSQVQDSVDGRYALKVNRGEAQASAATSVRKEGVAFETGATYLFSMYVKNVSFADHTTNNEGIHIYTSNVPGATADLVFHASSMPQGEWVCIQWLQTPTATAGSNVDIRVWGSGEVLIDNFSCYKLNRAFATYADADGHYSASLVDGGKAVITMPAAADDLGNAVALAVYSDVEGTKTLKSLKMKMITATDVEAGYAQFTLTADALGDFATADYTAKIMTMKNGTLVPLQDVVLYKEAQEA